MKVLVIGAAGMLGRKLVERLAHASSQIQPNTQSFDMMLF